MADNTTVAEESRSTKPTSLIKGQSGSSGTGSMSSTASSKHSLKHGLNMNLSSGLKSGSGVSSPDVNKHHYHHHHHHHHHTHSHNNPHVIHRTTSESLRLGSEVANSPASGHSSSSASTNCNSSASNTSGSQTSHTNTPLTTNQRKPKTSSFQITSVTVGNKLSADNGEDSADDLDESHTDDNSRITDLENETPSVSEDTFSKEDVFFSSNALGAAPVIPTSSQYGLVIVDPDLGGVGPGGQTLSNVHVSVTDAGINIVGPAGTKLCDADQKDLQHRNERFKVVKIESTEPFKRGRWMCMDYLDHTTLQQSQSSSENSSAPPSVGTSGNPTTNDSGVNVTENHVDSTEDPPDINAQGHIQNMPVSPGQTLQNSLPASSVEQANQTSTISGAGNVSNSVHAQTMTHVPNVPSVSMTHQNTVAQSLPHVTLQQNVSGQQSASSNQQPQTQTSTDFVSASSSNVQGQSQPAQFYANSQQQNVACSHIHGTTLPSNITMQNGVPTNLASVAEQKQDIAQPLQPVQSVQQIQSQQNPISTSSLPTSTGLQDNRSISVTSMPQPVTQQQPPGSSLPAAVLQQNISQAQVSNESYAPHSVAQSYATPPVATSTLTNVANTAIGQEINPDISIGLSQTPQTSGVISPASAGTPASSTVPSIDTNIQSGIVGSAPAVIPETASTSAASVSDASTLITASQPQPQVPVAPSLQSQQSVIASEESQSVAGETDTERVSSLALALSSTERPPSKPITINVSNTAGINNNISTFDKLEISEGPHFRRSHNLVALPKLNKESYKENPINLQSQSGLYTDLALGKRVFNLIDSNSNREKELSNKLSANLKNMNENKSEMNNEQGIPIPKLQRSHLERNISYSASPTYGTNLCSPFFNETSLSPTDSMQTASSCEPFTNYTSLKEIGKTLSTPIPSKQKGSGNSPLKSNRTNQIQQTSRLELRNRTADNSASGTSAVAIDNKIEQAMDLVKSHLMIAVREEVEVLKEKIAELMDRINQLELENTILKANVSQETLSQLSATMQTASTANTTTTPAQQPPPPASVQKPPVQNTNNTSNGPIS